MRILINLLLITLLSANCQLLMSQDTIIEKRAIFNKQLSDELLSMYSVDQFAASNAFPPEQYKHFTQVQWDNFKDSIYIVNKNRAEIIFNQFGYPGYDLVGKKGENCFYAIVQHADFDPIFQKKVLSKMGKEVKKSNAHSINYGYLTDRVLLNTGRPQIYGTQVEYDANGNAQPRNLSDSLNVDKRRAEIGLEPLDIYLKEITKMSKMLPKKTN